MLRRWSLLLWLAFSSTGWAQTITRQNLAGILGFENSSSAGYLVDWYSGPPGTIFADDRVVHNGKYSARLERDASSLNAFSTVTMAIPLDFVGKTVEWRGFIKTENVDGFVALWLREDGDAPIGSPASAASGNARTAPY
jgi:hypothetical protein